MDSFINFLNNISSPPNTSSTPAGDDPPHPNFPPNQNTPNQNYPPPPNSPPPPHQNFPGYHPYPQNPNYPPQNPNYPPNFPQNPMFPPHSNFPGFAQYPYSPVPTKPAHVQSSSPRADTKGRKLWTAEEEKVLVGAHLTISTDAVVGNDQKGHDFWKRVTAYYNEHVGTGHSRSLKQCKTHYHSLMKVVGEFIGIYSHALSRWPSGASDEQITADAREAFMRQNDNKPFKFEHIWRMVREEPKWKTPTGFSSSYQSTKKTRINEAGEYTSSGPPETPASQAESNYDYPDFEPPSTEEPPSVERRPMGQKAAKRKGKGKVGEPSNTDPEPDDRYVEVSEMLAGKYDNLAAVVNEHTKLQERIKRAEWQQKLYDLEDKDTTNMTPAALARHQARIASIREMWGFN